MPPSLIFTAAAWEQFKAFSAKAYPNEGCGLLVGPLALQTAGQKRVEKVILLKNKLLDEGRGRFDFRFSPEEFMQRQLESEAAGLDVVGIFHTHPDHPPRPSKTDENQPMLAGWINIIAGVNGGVFKEAKAWWREEDGQPFIESPITHDL